MADEKDTALASLGMSPSEFGAALIAEAVNQDKTQRLKANIERVRGIRQELIEAEATIERATAWKKIAETKLAAIEAGEFQFNKWSEMIFNDSKLNESETTTFGLPRRITHA
jgi:hypothetical protein